MRVVAGSARGRPLRAPTGKATRPTSDRVRESVFNILTSLALFDDGPRVLDLFAGSGALGIEALSRGAASSIFVDSDTPAVETIAENLAALGWSGPPNKVIRADVGTWVRSGGGGEVRQADVALIDPPYAFDTWAPLLSDLAGAGFSGLVVAEAGAEIDGGAAWDVVRVRRYGTTVVSLLRPGVLAGVTVGPKGGV